MLTTATTQPSTSDISRQSALIGLLLIAPVPTVGVWFGALSETGSLGGAIWAVAKVWLLIGPALWWWFAQKQPVRWPKVSGEGLLVGTLSGAVLAIVIFGAYWVIARPNMDFADLSGMLREVGITSVTQYLMLVCYLTLVNALIEEYVFRWFMVTQLSTLVSGRWAVLLSALVFTVHHTLVLTVYVPWHFNLLASLGVFTGALIWSAMFFKYRTVWPSYVSHIGADIGVFLIGYHALFVS